jgi:hypothetical protein
LPATEGVRTELHNNLRTLLRLYNIELTDQIEANPLQSARNQAFPQTAATANWHLYTGQLYRLVKLKDPGIRMIKAVASKRKTRSQLEQETGQEDTTATKRARASARLGVTTHPALTEETQQQEIQTIRTLRPKQRRGDTLDSRDLNYIISSDLLPGVQLTKELTEACQCETLASAPPN